MLSWKDALRKYATQTGKHIIPKKGTQAYDQVKELMMGGAYGPNSVRCTDKNVRIGRRGTAGECFNLGKKVGYRAGILKGQAQAHQAPQAPQRPPLETMSSRALADLARQNGIRKYYNMKKSELMEALLPIYGQP